jgi:hypothetical protein
MAEAQNADITPRERQAQSRQPHGREARKLQQVELTEQERSKGGEHYQQEGGAISRDQCDTSAFHERTPCQRPEMPCGMTRNRTIAAINKAACPMTGVAMSEKADSTTPNKPAAETVSAISALPPLITVTNARAT